MNDKVYFLHADKRRSILQVDTIILGVSNQGCLKYLKYLHKKHFYLQINTKVFYKMIVLLWVCVARYAQSAENIKVTISLQYLEENVKDKVGFLPVDNCRWFLQSDAIISGFCD